MDIFYFIKVLWRRKWMIGFAILFAAVATYLLIGLLPPKYKSEALIATGITVRKNIKLSNEDPFVQKYEIISAFSNLVTTMKSRTALRLLTYRLMLRDLAPDSLAIKQFRELELEDSSTLSQAQIERFYNFLSIYNNDLSLVQLDQSQNITFNQLAKGLGYDFETLTEDLNIERLGETDYLKVEFISENPALCEFVVNTYCEEFLRYNLQNVNREEGEAVNFYSDLSRDKRTQLDRLDRQLNQLKEKNSIVNLNEQTKTVVNQVKELELEREQQQKTIPGLVKTIDLLDNYLDEYAQRNKAQEEQIKLINSGLVETIEQIKTLRRETTTGEQPKDPLTSRETIPEADINSKTIAQQALINQYIEELKRSKIDLDATLIDILDKRIEAEVSLALAQESVSSLDRRIQELKTNSTDLISVEAQIKTLESQREMALQEYLQAVSKLNDARVIAQTTLYPLSIFEYGQYPSEPEPSRKALFAAFAGIGGAGAYVFLIFLLILFDNTLNNASNFEKRANIPLLATLVRLPKRDFDLEQIFSLNTTDRRIQKYKESLRKIRREIELTGKKRFLISSTKDETDRSSFLMALAFSLTQKKHRVLVVDTNFKQNRLSEYAAFSPKGNPLMNSNERLDRYGRNEKYRDNPLIEVIPCSPSQESPSEILANKNFEAFLAQQESEFDFVLLEAPGFNDYADGQEILAYADKVILVFEAQASFGRTDESSIATLHRGASKLMGGVLTGVDPINLE